MIARSRAMQVTRGRTEFGLPARFAASGAAWSQQAKLVASDAAMGDNFGYDVAISGDTAVVGAYGDDDLGLSSGSAYVFVRTGTVWTEQAKLNANDGAAGDLFGGAVSVHGDTAVVGAPYDEDFGFRSGSAYVFRRTGSTWSQEAKLVAGDGATEDIFGFSLAIDGDSVIVGADFKDGVSEHTGAAYVFTRTGLWIQGGSPWHKWLGGHRETSGRNQAATAFPTQLTVISRRSTKPPNFYRFGIRGRIHRTA
jgi:hypothetical protein